MNRITRLEVLPREQKIIAQLVEGGATFYTVPLSEILLRGGLNARRRLHRDVGSRNSGNDLVGVVELEMGFEFCSCLHQAVQERFIVGEVGLEPFEGNAGVENYTG